MFLLDMVLVQRFLQNSRSQRDREIHLDCLVVQVQMLPPHRQTLQHMSHWEMSALHIKKFKTNLNNPYKGVYILRENRLKEN